MYFLVAARVVRAALDIRATIEPSVALKRSTSHSEIRMGPEARSTGACCATHTLRAVWAADPGSKKLESLDHTYTGGCLTKTRRAIFAARLSVAHRSSSAAQAQLSAA